MRKKYSAENSGEKNFEKFFPLKILEKKIFEKNFEKFFPLKILEKKIFEKFFPLKILEKKYSAEKNPLGASGENMNVCHSYS